MSDHEDWSELIDEGLDRMQNEIAETVEECADQLVEEGLLFKGNRNAFARGLKVEMCG